MSLSIEFVLAKLYNLQAKQSTTLPLPERPADYLSGSVKLDF